jgi:UMF1 family MFS transporter
LIIGIFMRPKSGRKPLTSGPLRTRGKGNEFYGFFAFSGKATSFWGFAINSIMTTAFGGPRYRAGAILVFFLIGGLILVTVDERAGVTASGRTAAS